MTYLIQEHHLSVQRSCECLGVSRAAHYRDSMTREERDAEVIAGINAVIDLHPRWGFWKSIKRLRKQGRPWNHKRVHRVYCNLGLNMKRRAKRRLPLREKQPLAVPQQPNQTWSADFMSDALYVGNRFRTFNVIDDFNREVLAVEIDTSITGRRLIRVFERLQFSRGLPAVLRCDNGPEFLSGDFVDWCKTAGVTIQYIQPGTRAAGERAGIGLCLRLVVRR